MGLPLRPDTLALAALALVLGQLIVRAVYRLFLSPLAAIPGPKLAALTSLYECYYDVVKPGQYVFKIKQLHEQYGPVVRITPSEVSISDPEFIDTIYAPGPGHKRDKDIHKVKGLGINTSVGGAVSHDLHRHRREALNPFFSKQNISRLGPRLASKVEQLEGLFTQAQASGEVLNLSDLYFGFANDVVREYCFGHAQNLLGDPALAHKQRENVAGVLRSVKFNLHFPFVRDWLRKLPPSIGARFTPPGVRDMIQFRISIRKEIRDILAAHKTSQPITAPVPSPTIFTTLRDSPALPPSEKAPHRLEDEATLLVMAGTESTAKSLAIAHYHLLANPSALAKLRAELAQAGSTPPDQLPYLNGVIQEAHRLSFGLTGRNPRVCPDEVITYPGTPTTTQGTGGSAKGYTFPPGTPLSASTLLIHTNTTIFPSPWEFQPERWLGSEGATRKKYMLAFMRGPRQCVGMHLANAEMAVAVAAMARWEMELVGTGEGDVRFLHDYHVATPRLGSRGVRVRVTGDWSESTGAGKGMERA